MESFDKVIQPEELSVLSIFSGVEYLVPIYQRNYAWEEKEIVQLLDDINDSTENYYLGTLIVNQRSVNTFEVIDGQQRLTTLYLLLKFLDPKIITNNALKFEAREKSNKTLAEISKIVENNISAEKSWFSEEIIDGYYVISKYFKKKGNQAFVDGFLKKLDKVKIIRIQVPHGIDLNHYFEVMNTRGEQLELHEIVKGKILDTITDAEDKMLAATIWDCCAQMDRYIQMNFDSDSRKRLFGDDWKEFQCIDFDDIKSKLENHKSNSNPYTLLSKLENPVIDDEAKKIEIDNKNRDEEYERFESIVSFPVFLLIVNEAINASGNEDDSGLDDKRFISLMKTHYSNNTNALTFIFELLRYRYLFDKFIIKREYAKDYKKDGRWSLQRLEMYKDTKGDEKPIYKGTYNSGETDSEDADDTKKLRWLQSCLRITYTSPKTMHWISRALSFVRENESGRDLTNCLEEYCCQKIAESDYRNKTGFKIDRIVFTYLDYVLCRNNRMYNNYQFQFRTSIEHFYPQHPVTNEFWEDGYLNCFGNLALITVSSNSKFSNLLPHQKVEDYPDHIDQSPKLQKMSKLMEENNNKWERELARQHGNEMLDLLEKELNNHQ